MSHSIISLPLFSSFSNRLFFTSNYNEKRICYYPSTFLFLTHPLSLILPLSIFIVAGNCKIKPKLEALPAQEEKGTEQGRRDFSCEQNFPEICPTSLFIFSLTDNVTLFPTAEAGKGMLCEVNVLMENIPFR